MQSKTYGYLFLGFIVYIFIVVGFLMNRLETTAAQFWVNLILFSSIVIIILLLIWFFPRSAEMTGNMCIYKTEIFNQLYITNKNSITWITVILTFLIATIGGLYQEYYLPQLNDDKMMDFWSFAHLLMPFGFMLFLLHVKVSPKISFVIAFVIVCLWEVVEWSLLPLLNASENEGSVWSENIGNVISDLIFNTIGIILAYFFIKRKDPCDQLFVH